MSINVSSRVCSPQHGIHKDLAQRLRRHRKTGYLSPIPTYEREQIENLRPWVAGYHCRVVLDNGCGTGMSTLHLAQKFRGCAVIGIDKSRHRLQRASVDMPENMRLVRADLVHFLRLVQQAGWHVVAQFFLYPNPWPKPKHLKRRWHGHPIFTTIMELGGCIELRTNWLPYAQEFAFAVEEHTHIKVDVARNHPQQGISRFECKYLGSAHPLYCVCASVSSNEARIQPASGCAIQHG